MKKVTIYNKYPLLLPEGELANWDVFDYWEKERFESMQSNLSPGSLMWDVGTEHGWLAALYQKYLGINMGLIEPTPQFWPSIKAIWEANELEMPEFCFHGLVGHVGRSNGESVIVADWPNAASGKLLKKGVGYRYLHNAKDLWELDYIALDMLLISTGSMPDALNIDVEGAEFEVIMGAKDILREGRAKIWVSVHPDLMFRDYQTDPSMLHVFIENYGYRGTKLAVDHEEHWFYEKR